MDGWSRILGTWVWITGNQRHKTGMCVKSFRASHEQQSVLVPVKKSKNNNDW
jgi:hypothetical protein